MAKNIRRNTHKKYSSEEKVCIVIEGLRRDLSIAELCRREGTNRNSHYKWSKELLEARR
jgi:transposase